MIPARKISGASASPRPSSLFSFGKGYASESDSYTVIFYALKCIFVSWKFMKKTAFLMNFSYISACIKLFIQYVHGWTYKEGNAPTANISAKKLAKTWMNFDTTCCLCYVFYTKKLAFQYYGSKANSFCKKTFQILNKKMGMSEM